MHGVGCSLEGTRALNLERKASISALLDLKSNP